MKNYLYILLLLLTASCGISEDCFKGNGSEKTLIFPYDNFTKVKVYSGVGLVVKEGPEYEVKIETRDNIKDNIEVTLQGEMLIVKDNSTCNIARDYGVTTVYVTVPDGSVHPLIQALELHSKTEQQVLSEGVLHSPIVRLFSIGDDGDGSGSSNFYINLETTGQLVVETNTISNFFINGFCKDALLNFYFGDTRFNGENFEVETIKVFQRGSNDMIVKPIQRIEGQILSTGNVILKNNPPEVEVEEFYTGRLIYN